MTRKKLLKVSIITLGLAVLILVFNYFFYHYFTSNGFTSTFYKEAQKPFVANLIGQLGVLFLFASIMSTIFAFICFEKENK